MSATTVERTKRFAGLVPGRGTLSAAANKLFLKGTIVQIDAAGRATPGVDGNGFHAAGVASSTFYNRTTDPSGGGADAIDVEVEYGVFGFYFTGTTPEPGQTVWVVDNQTVSTDSDTGARGVAGVCLEVRDDQAGVAQCYVWMNPAVAELFSDDSALSTAVTTAQTDIDALQADALTAQAFIPIPIFTWLDGGAPMAAFVDGSVNGTQLTDSEAAGFRFNPVGQDTSVLSTSVPLPADLDDAADIVLHVMCFRVGSSDTTTVLAGNAFFQTVGAAHTADADAITVDSAAIDAATTVVEEVTLTIAAADVPAAPCTLTLTLAPSAALDADDLVIVGTWLEYTRALLTA
jgi:hypothetical protein